MTFNETIELRFKNNNNNNSPDTKFQVKNYITETIKIFL